MPVDVGMRHKRVILQISAIPERHMDLVEVFLLLLLLSADKRVDRLRLILIPILRILLVISKRATLHENHVPIRAVRVVYARRHDA